MWELLTRRMPWEDEVPCDFTAVEEATYVTPCMLTLYLARCGDPSVSLTRFFLRFTSFIHYRLLRSLCMTLQLCVRSMRRSFYCLLSFDLCHQCSEPLLTSSGPHVRRCDVRNKTHTHTHTHTYIHTHTHKRTHAHTHARTRTLTHSHTHTHTLLTLTIESCLLSHQQRHDVSTKGAAKGARCILCELSKDPSVAAQSGSSETQNLPRRRAM